jgi:hypothetical protein
MKYRFIVLAVGALLTGPAQSQSLAAGCYPVKGKITNNAHTPAPSIRWAWRS